MPSPPEFLPETQAYLRRCQSPDDLARLLREREGRVLNLFMQANRHVVGSNKARSLAIYLAGLTLGAFFSAASQPLFLTLFGITMAVVLIRLRRDRAIDRAVKTRIANLQSLGLVNCALSHHHADTIEGMEAALGLSSQPVPSMPHHDT
ncbi:hypothetical protein [Synechococcus sp. RS9916]|uniref:hypothetical protein n=1 Tax=Synechococcus sp. RS9916 TaxID=221359 RepID=UPI0000E533B5|nr:hypothetical protein [Synechococcus sp. RS9916]EAU75166.1 hypothetical protein RS9916_36702 [Synechococcus sp. RS9916]